MPSRRRVLTVATGLAVTGLGSTAGCLARTPLAGLGFLAYQAIEVGWTHEGHSMTADLAFFEYDRRDRLWGWVADAYPELLTPAGGLRTTDTAMDRLGQDFESITFQLQFSPVDGSTNPDWHRAFASHRDFDRVAFGDRAAIRYDFPHVRVLEVYEGAQGDPATWDHEIGLFDFSESYAHAGAPEI